MTGRLSVFKMVASFVDVSESQIEQFKENVVPQKTKDATKFRVKLFKGRLSIPVRSSMESYLPRISLLDKIAVNVQNLVLTANVWKTIS